MGPKYDLSNLALSAYDYQNWYKEKSDDSTEKDDESEFCDLLPLESDEEIKERKGLTILPPNKLLTRHSVIFVQIKAGNSSYKPKSEIRQIPYLLHQRNKITRTYNHLIKSLK